MRGVGKFKLNADIINDFRSGELTPSVDARADIKPYYTGCRTLENALPIIEGGVKRMPGCKYVRPVKQIEEGWGLRITKSGDGTGVVTSDIVGIDCGASCYIFFIDGTTIVLTGTADAGNTFIGWSGEGLSGIVPASLLMNGNKVVNAEFSPVPQNDYLIGWYKFNEGNGAVAANSATGGSSGGGLFPDLDVINGASFWTGLAGFASVLTVWPATSIDWATFTLGVARTFGGSANGYSSMGIFFKKNTAGGSRLVNLHQFIFSGGITIAPDNPDANDLSFNLTGGSTWVNETVSLNNWYFFFYDSEGYACQVNPNGTLSVSTTISADTTAGTINYLHVGTGWNGNTDGAGGNFGDLIIYNFKRLTRAEWASWYDKCRSRYGMSARSGW